MPKKNSFPFVQVLWRDRVKKIARGYRGWAMFAGKRKFGPVRQAPGDAHKDAMTMRGMLEAPSFGGAFETRANDWLANVGATRSADTVDFYKSKLAAIYRTIPKTIAVDRISAAVVREFMREAVEKHAIGARTLQHCRRTLNGLFKWCIGRGYLQSNPLVGMSWPKPEETQPDVFGKAELTDLLVKITDPAASDLVLFMATTGLRRAEMARLRAVDVDLLTGTVWIRGKSRSQSGPILEDGIDAARRLVAAAGEFMVNGDTDRGRRERIAETFRTWQRKLKEPRLHPHALRHSMATIMLRDREGSAIVQRFLRHSSYATTKKYEHLVESDVRAAGTRLRLVGKDEKAAENA